MLSSAGFEDCGTAMFAGADVLIRYNLPDERKFVSLGLCKDGLTALAEIGRAILAVGCRNYPKNIEHRLLVELAARVRVGINGDATYHSLLALAAFHALSNPAILDLAGRGDAVDAAIRDGRKPSCSITPRSSTGSECCSDGPAGRSGAGWAAPSGARSDELLIKVQMGRWGQYLTVPHDKIDKWIKHAARCVASYPPDEHEPLLGLSVCILVSLYQNALMGDLPDVPASTLDWRDLNRSIAGSVCWLLRKRGLLHTALCDPGKHIAVLAFEPDAAGSFTLSLEPVTPD